MKNLILLIIMVSLCSISYAKTIKEKSNLANPETQSETILDNIYIKPNTKQITVRSTIIYYDADGKEVSRKQGETKHIMDSPATLEDEACTDYTDIEKDFNKFWDVLKEKL